MEDYYVQSKVRNNHHKQAGEICEGGLVGGRTWEKKDGESLPLQGVFYLERNMVVVMMMTMKITLLMMMLEPWRVLSEDDLITLGSLMCWRAMRVKANLSEKAGLHPVGCQLLE